MKEYKADRPVEIDPMETPHSWYTNLDVLPRLRYFTDPNKYFGTTIAGQAEFPWVVDVRHLELQADGWAIGNLVNPNWVLTACNVVRDWQKVEECSGVSPNGNYVVYFCTNFVYEDYYRFGEGSMIEYHLARGGDENGVRRIVKFIRHPNCKVTLKRTWNFALMKMSSPIPVYFPVTGYIPFYQGEDHGAAQSLSIGGSVLPVLEKMDKRETKKVCYVASFGRPYWNVAFPQNLDYKVKYRAYFSKYEHCSSGSGLSTIPYRLCYNNGNEPNSTSEANIPNPTCLESIRQNGGVDGQFVCMRTYAKHGAVCDHDRGAPLVCNGEVFGFVTRGVPENWCVNTRMYPVLVIKVDYLKGAQFDRGEPNFGSALTPFPRD